MIIIAFEGLDKSGKNTQTMMLVKSLIDMGYTVSTTDFHRYDTPTGGLIRQWLYREYDVDRTTMELIMAADKQAQQAWFKDLERQGVDFMILDRYVGSQTCYAIGDGLDKDWVFSLQANLIKPDLEILIDISPEQSLSRKGQHGDNDRYESDLQFLGKVRKEYHQYFRFEGAYHLREGQNKQSRVFLPDCDTVSVDFLHEIILDVVKIKFGLDTESTTSVQ